MLGTDDRVVADLDLVAVSLRFGAFLGDEPTRRGLLAKIELIDREREQAVRIPARW